MKIKPVKNRIIPKYPDKYEIELNKALLYYRPKSWLGKPIIGLSLTALLTAGVNMGCWYFLPPLGGDPLPPDYINVSDIDALRIITEELTNAGYTIEIPGTKNEKFQFDGKINSSGITKDIEYVSKDDCQNQKYPELYYSGYHDPEYVAYQLKEKYPDAAILKNPYPWENPEEAIRTQVRDFLEWLAASDM